MHRPCPGLAPMSSRYSFLTEIRSVWRAVRERQFMALLGAMLLACAVVLQVPYRFDLDVGAVAPALPGNSFDHLVGQTFRDPVGRGYDEVFLEHFFASEQAGGVTFRWSATQAAIDV